jgi:hypothetical protein
MQELMQGAEHPAARAEPARERVKGASRIESPRRGVEEKQDSGKAGNNKDSDPKTPCQKIKNRVRFGQCLISSLAHGFGKGCGKDEKIEKEHAQPEKHAPRECHPEPNLRKARFLQSTSHVPGFQPTLGLGRENDGNHSKQDAATEHGDDGGNEIGVYFLRGGARLAEAGYHLAALMALKGPVVVMDAAV